MRALDAALTALTAAVVGAIASLALWFGVRLFARLDPASALLASEIAIAAWIALVLRGWGVGWVV